jgi:hypothetical protein
MLILPPSSGRPREPRAINVGDPRWRNAVAFFPLTPALGGSELLGSRHGKVEGPGPYGLSPLFGSGLQCDGSATNVNAGNIPILDGATSFTIALWLKMAASPSSSGKLVTKWDNNGADQSFTLERTSTLKLIFGMVQSSGSQASIYQTTNDVLAALGDFRVVLTWAGSSTWACYVNGASAALSSVVVQNTPSFVQTTTTPFRIGAGGATAGAFSDDLIADVYVAKNRVWSAADVAFDYALSTRWDLFYRPRRAAFLSKPAAATFKAAWAAHANHLITGAV